MLKWNLVMIKKEDSHLVWLAWIYHKWVQPISKSFYGFNNKALKTGKHLFQRQKLETIS